MSRTPSMTVEQCEAILGPRGQLRVTADNFQIVRKWCVASGLPGIYAYKLAYAQLAGCYNKPGRLDWHKTQAVNGGEVGDAPEEANDAGNVNPAPEANKPVVIDNPAPAGSLESAIESIVIRALGKVSPALDVDKVTDIVRREINGVAPREVLIKEQNHEDIRINARTPDWFERVVKLLKYGAKHNVNVCLVGPAGCGKTFMVHLIAKALGCERHTIVSGSAGVSESALTGRLLPTGANGAFEYSPSEAVDCYVRGNSLICFDEIDAFDPNMLMIANVPLANGHWYIPHRISGPCVERGENVYFLATANTYGTSANPIYAARAQLDGATLDRFVFVAVDYDVKFEEEQGLALGLTANECSQIWEFRNKVREKELRRVVSTRAFLKAAVMRMAGDSWSSVMATLTAGWSKDEKAKVGLAA